MSSNFPKIPEFLAENFLVGEDFDVMKKNSMEKYGDNVYKFSYDRFIPSRQVNSEFLQESREEDFDVSLSENNLRTMKKVQYQNALKILFYEHRPKHVNSQHESKKKKNNGPINKSLIHLDWACKLTNIREKFLPDFETLEKKSFFRIENYLWSTKNIIAAASNKKVCLYHPINGFTRALDITDKVTLAFSHGGDFLAMAYRKSRRSRLADDLYLFEIHQDALFNSEKLHTEKIRTPSEGDITAMCFTSSNDFLICGTDIGKIYVFECQPKLHQRKLNDSNSHHSWILTNVLDESHKHKVVKICFSATSRYMATLDNRGCFKIWNGGSWTFIFSDQFEKSKQYKHFEWHPFVETDLIVGRQFPPALYLFNVSQREIVAAYSNWKENWQITSVAFNPVTAQLAVCFYDMEEYVNRVCLLASMSQVISQFDFDYIEGGLKLFWNSSGLMLGAGAETFRFAFWSFFEGHDFHGQMMKASNMSNQEKILTLSDSKRMSIR